MIHRKDSDRHSSYVFAEEGLKSSVLRGAEEQRERQCFEGLKSGEKVRVRIVGIGWSKDMQTQLGARTAQVL